MTPPGGPAAGFTHTTENVMPHGKLLLTALALWFTPAAAPGRQAPAPTQAVLRITGDILPDRGGFKIATVEANGPATRLEKADAPNAPRASLKVGDVITRVDGRAFADLAEFRGLINDAHRTNDGRVRVRVTDARTGGETDFIARPDVAGAAAAPATNPAPGARGLVGKRVIATRPGVRFGHTGPNGAPVYVGEITDPSVEVVGENGQWVQVRQGKLVGWCPRADLVVLDGAVEYFDRRLTANPADVFALAGKAAAHLEQKEYDRARDAYEAAARVQPREATWAERLGAVAEREGKPDAAARAYARANELSPARRAQQDAAAKDLVAPRAALAQQERLHEARLKALATREQAAAGAGPEERQEVRAERDSLIHAHDVLAAKREDLARREIRTGLPGVGEPAPAPAREPGGAGSALDALTTLKPDVRSGDVVKRFTDEDKPAITGTWSPVGEGWFVYEFEAGKDGSGKVTRRPGKGNIDSSTKYGTWKAKDEKTVVLELPESGRKGYSSYSAPVTVEVKVVSPTELLIGKFTYRGGKVTSDGE